MTGEVEPLAVVWADDEGRVPVVTLRLFGLARDRRNAHSLAGASVEAHQAAVLALGVDGVRVFGIDARNEAVAAVGLEPVGVDYARLAARFGRAAYRVVVLRAAVDEIPRRLLIDVHVVKLRDGQVRFEVPVRAAIVAFIQAAVAAYQVIVRVVRIDPDGVVVYVFQPLAQRALRPAAVVRNLEDDVRDVDAVNVLRIADDLAVIHPLRDVRTHTLPGRPLVVRAKDAATLPCRFDRGVDDVVIGRRNGQSDAPQVSRRQGAGGGAQPRPRRAAVGGLMNRAFRSAVDQCVEV